MNLVSTFGASVEKQPEKSALFWGERVYSYRELWTQTLLVHRQLQERFKLKRGDRVGLWLKNCPEFIPALFGILQAGAVAVPINNFLKPDEVSYILNDGGIDVLITDSELGAHFAALATSRPNLRLFQPQEQLNSRRANPNDAEWPASNGKASSRVTQDSTLVTPEITESDLAVLIYTSGTTGRPKG